jgi:hypothetical protein
MELAFTSVDIQTLRITGTTSAENPMHYYMLLQFTSVIWETVITEAIFPENVPHNNTQHIF